MPRIIFAIFTKFLYFLVEFNTMNRKAATFRNLFQCAKILRGFDVESKLTTNYDAHCKAKLTDGEQYCRNWNEWVTSWRVVADGVQYCRTMGCSCYCLG